MPGTVEGTGMKVSGGVQVLALVGFGDIVFSVVLIDEHLSAIGVGAQRVLVHYMIDRIGHA
jgi:hypothetical protein